MKRIAILSVVMAMLGVVGYFQIMKTSAKDKETKNPVVIMDTSMGKIEIELNAAKAPITVKNFLKYVDDKFYDGTIFHRVIGKENSDDDPPKDFMIQGGGFKRGLIEKEAGDPIKNEASNGLSNKRGTIAMARTKNPDSATAQFYINVADNTFLDKTEDNPGYAVFGKVIKGMEVVNKIKAVKTGVKKGMPNVPVEDVIIKSVRRAPEKKSEE